MYVMHSIASLYPAKCKKMYLTSDWTNNGRNASMYKCTGQFSKIVFQSFFADDTILVMGWNICTLNTVKSRTIWFPSGK